MNSFQFSSGKAFWYLFFITIQHACSGLGTLSFYSINSMWVGVGLRTVRLGLDATNRQADVVSIATPVSVSCCSWTPNFLSGIQSKSKSNLILIRSGFRILILISVFLLLYDSLMSKCQPILKYVAFHSFIKPDISLYLDSFIFFQKFFICRIKCSFPVRALFLFEIIKLSANFTV